MKKIIILAIILFSTTAWGLTISPDSTRVNENDVTVWFTVSDGGDSYPFHGDFKQGVDIQSQLDAQKDKLYLLILKKMYRGAEPEENTLESMQKWIADGAENITLTQIEGVEEPVEIKTRIEKKEWKSTHPKPSRLDELEARIVALEAK